SLVPPAVLQLAFVFPQPHRLAPWRFVQYGLAAAVIVLYELFLYRPAVYSRLLGFNMAFLGLACFVLAARLVSEYRHGSSQLARAGTRRDPRGPARPRLARRDRVRLRGLPWRGRGEPGDAHADRVRARRRLRDREARSLRDRCHGEARGVLPPADRRSGRGLR